MEVYNSTPADNRSAFERLCLNNKKEIWTTGDCNGLILGLAMSFYCL